MLIPIGFLGGGAAAGAYELISTVYGTGSSGTITFSSIPSTYKHLQIRYTVKSSGANNDLRFAVNGYTSGFYDHFLKGDGNSVSSGISASGSYILLGQGVSSSTTANAYVGGVLDILDYSSTSKNKTIRALYGKADAVNNITLASGLVINTAAIASISFALSSTNFTTTSRFSLYGIKGA